MNVLISARGAARRLARLSAVGVLLAAGVAQASDVPGASAAFWRGAATADVEAAYRLVQENHPGMVAEAKDPGFKARLDHAHAMAVERAATVDGYGGYAGALAGFAVALGDKHLRSRPTLVLSRPKWASLIVSRRPDGWIVQQDERGAADSLVGARLVGCDGVPVEALAATILGGFRVDWSVAAQQVQAAPWLLVDEDNPFVSRPQRCAFDGAAGARTVDLAWRPIRRELLTPKVQQGVGAGSAGFGVRAVADGYWISLQELMDRAVPVVDQARATQDALRAARFVVLDLRGNGGGSSHFGRQIAEILLGPDVVRAKLGDDSADCSEVWRPSPLNLATLRGNQDIVARIGDAQTRKLVADMLRQAEAAAARGAGLAGPIDCPTAAVKTAAAPPPSPMKGTLFVLTDSLCFSACLVVVEDMRKLGALQIGHQTDVATRYTQVLDRPMPSGLSTFSTLEAVGVGVPLRYGGFEPHVRYPGDISDTAALEAWVSTVLVH